MNSRATSYQDLLRSFQQAETTTQTPRAQKLTYKPTTSKIPKSNKQNYPSKKQLQSLYEKSISHKSQWIEQDILKEHHHKRKQKQTELAYHKFITHITGILVQEIGILPPELLTQKITYLQFLAALKNLSMIRQNYQPSPNDCTSLLWNQLNSHGQSCGILILLIAAILNFRKQDEEHILNYQQLHKKYAELRYTRMEIQGKVKTQIEQEEHSYTPCISHRSRTIAASRSKSKTRRDRCKAEQRSFNNFVQEQPQNPSNLSSIHHLDSQAGNRRSQILYKQAKQKSLQKRRDKKPNEIQYQKSIRELTFHPKIHPNSVRNIQKKKIQGEQDSINRMIRGRIERQVRNIINQKGLPYNEKLFQKMKKERYQALQKHKKNQCLYPHHKNYSQNTQQSQDSPQKSQPQSDNKKNRQPIVLTIEVDEDRCQKLVIDDPNHYRQAAAKFIQDLKLGPDMYEKLLQGVEKALKFQLTQVDQDSCESQQQSLQ